MWVTDEVDLERGVYIQRIGRKEITALNINSVEYHSFRVSVKGLFPWTIGEGYAYCNQYRWHSVSQANADDMTFRVYNEKSSAGNSGVAYLYLRDDRFSSVDEANAWFAEHPLIVYSMLSKHNLIELTHDEIQAFKNFESCKALTYLSNSAGIAMKSEQAIDTELYIDGKYKKLEARVTALEHG